MNHVESERLTCPYCGHVHPGPYQLSSGRSLTTCSQCLQEFLVVVKHLTIYASYGDPRV